MCEICERCPPPNPNDPKCVFPMFPPALLWLLANRRRRAPMRGRGREGHPGKRAPRRCAGRGPCCAAAAPGSPGTRPPQGSLRRKPCRCGRTIGVGPQPLPGGGDSQPFSLAPSPLVGVTFNFVRFPPGWEDLRQESVTKVGGGWLFANLSSKHVNPKRLMEVKFWDQSPIFQSMLKDIYGNF